MRNGARGPFGSRSLEFACAAALSVCLVRNEIESRRWLRLHSVAGPHLFERPTEPHARETVWVLAQLSLGVHAVQPRNSLVPHAPRQVEALVLLALRSPRRKRIHGNRIQRHLVRRLHPFACLPRHESSRDAGPCRKTGFDEAARALEQGRQVCNWDCHFIQLKSQGRRPHLCGRDDISAAQHAKTTAFGQTDRHTRRSTIH